MPVLSCRSLAALCIALFSRCPERIAVETESYAARQAEQKIQGFVVDGFPRTCLVFHSVMGHKHD